MPHTYSLEVAAAAASHMGKLVGSRRQGSNVPHGTGRMIDHLFIWCGVQSCGTTCMRSLPLALPSDSMRILYQPARDIVLAGMMLLVSCKLPTSRLWLHGFREHQEVSRSGCITKSQHLVPAMAFDPKYVKGAYLNSAEA